MAKLKLRAGHAATIILVAAMLLPLPAQGRIGGFPSLCMTQTLFGIPCALCGMTRSFVCMGHGKLEEALSYHLLGPAVFVSIAIVAVLDISRRKWRPSHRLSQGLIAIGAATFGVVWVARLSGFWPFPAN